MCWETMDATLKLIKNDCLRKTTKSGSTLRRRPFRVSEEQKEADKRRGAAVVRRPTTRRFLRRQQRRAPLAELASRVLAETGEKKKHGTACERINHYLPAGAMAPENTTQYLMSNVYEDLNADFNQSVSHESSAHNCYESLSPNDVYAALDSDFEGCLAFQQRDFEDIIGLAWKPE